MAVQAARRKTTSRLCSYLRKAQLSLSPRASPSFVFPRFTIYYRHLIHCTAIHHRSQSLVNSVPHICPNRRAAFFLSRSGYTLQT